MSCNRNDAGAGMRKQLAKTAPIGVLALALAACVKNDAAPEPVMAPPEPVTMPAPSQTAPIYRVRSGSPSVLENYPRGSEVGRATRICLKEGEQITIAGTNGQQVSYRGPGCMQRNAQPSSTNQGGFTFGHNSYGVRDDVEMVP